MAIAKVNFTKVFFMIAMIACYALIFTDESGIAVILPYLQKNLSLSNNALHWVINSYLLVLSILLLLGGKLADLYGRRRIFTIGISVFIFASIMCASAATAWQLIAGRLLQGVGGSLLMPSITVLVHHVFKEGFGKAFGLILGFANIFYATGPFIGGVLTQYLSWRWFFLVNIPVGVICLVFTFITVAKDQPTPGRQFSDALGLSTFILTLSTFIFALMQGADWGWLDDKILSLLIIAIGGFVVFIHVELRAKEPLLDVRLFKNSTVAAAAIALCCTAICLSSLIFWALWLQKSLAFKPAMVGLALLPATLTFMFVPALASHWRERIGFRAPMLLGSTLIVGGLLWVLFTAAKQNYFLCLPGLISFGVGIPLMIPSSVTLIMGAVKPEQMGMASGTFTTIRQFSLTLGVAIFSAIIATFTHWQLPLKTLASQQVFYTYSFIAGNSGILLIACLALIITFKWIGK